MGGEDCFLSCYFYGFDSVESPRVGWPKFNFVYQIEQPNPFSIVSFFDGLGLIFFRHRGSF